MRRLFLISFLLILIVAIQEGYSQRSATAVMQVSVRVVEGTTIDMKQPDLIALEHNERSDLGQMSLKGINTENALITVASNLNIQNKEGNNIDVSVSSEHQENKDRNTIYKLFGSPNKLMKNGIYHGKLTTTIEYL